MKRTLIFLFYLAMSVSPLAAQEVANAWERGTDPVTLTTGLAAGEVYVTCVAHTGFIRVSAPATAAHPIAVGAGGDLAVSHEDRFEQGRVRGWFEAADPVWQTALAEGALTVEGRRIAFTSERDKRYFALTLRVCAAN